MTVAVGERQYSLFTLLMFLNQVRIQNKVTLAKRLFLLKIEYIKNTVVIEIILKVVCKKI